MDLPDHEKSTGDAFQRHLKVPLMYLDPQMRHQRSE